MTKIVAAVVLMLGAVPAFAADDSADAAGARADVQTVSGPTKPGARLSYQAAKSEGSITQGGAQHEKASTEKAMACACHHSHS